MRTNENLETMPTPPFKPTESQRATVSVAAGAGVRHADIAAGLGISRNTLEKYFADDLKVHAVRRRIDVLDALHRAAMQGNALAARTYLAHPARHRCRRC